VLNGQLMIVPGSYSPSACRDIADDINALALRKTEDTGSPDQKAHGFLVLKSQDRPVAECIPRTELIAETLFSPPSSLSLPLQLNSSATGALDLLLALTGASSDYCGVICSAKFSIGDRTDQPLPVFLIQIFNSHNSHDSWVSM
jgi:hypothetical protein